MTAVSNGRFKKRMGLKEELPSIRENIPLAPLTTFRIGGPARYFYQADNSGELSKAIQVAKKAGLPFFILGGGSNILVPDEGFDGLIIKVQNAKVKIKNDEIYAEAGALLGAMVAESVEAGLTGLEWAAGIPGTVGGAIRGNAGAYGSRISDVLREVEILDEKGNTGVLSVGGCEFGYRDSIFKRKPWIILSAKFCLKEEDERKSRRQIIAHFADRKRRIPSHPSAGCVFKNITTSDLRQRARKMIPKERSKEELIPAWYLIDRCGLKGERIGGAQISTKHANFIVNVDDAKANDVLALIRLCKGEVEKRFGVTLEEEIQYLGP